jgi:hypothetical protein
VTEWDLKAFSRALGAALVGLAVVWLVTAASDEGQLTAGARAGRTLPLAPLCSAVGAALALGTSRVREETLALEALGRSPAENARAAALGAALPSILLGLAILASTQVDVSAFYPRAPRGDVFVREERAFVSPALGVRVTDEDGAPAILARKDTPDEGLPRGARTSAAATTAVAGLALALLAARAALRASLQAKRDRRRRRGVAIAAASGCVLATLVLFQASAAHVAPAALAIVPSSALLVLVALGYLGATPRVRSALASPARSARPPSPARSTRPPPT